MGGSVDLLTLWEIVQKVGLGGCAVLILFARWKGWWVEGKLYDRVVEERDQLLTLALRGAISHERTTGILERVSSSDAAARE